MASSINKRKRSSVVARLPFTGNISGINNSELLTYSSPKEEEIQRKKRRPDGKANKEAELQNEAVLNDVQMIDHLKVCTDLFNSNKITTKNVWQLQIIDILNGFASQDSDNVFKIVSTSLDISAKVYCLRVDDLYKTCLQMASKIETPSDANINDAEINEVTRTKAKRRKLVVISKECTIEKKMSKIFGPPRLLDPRFFHTNDSIDATSIDNLISYRLETNITEHTNSLLCDSNYFASGIDMALSCSKTIPSSLPNINDFSLCWTMNNFKIEQDDFEAESGSYNNDNVSLYTRLSCSSTPVLDLDGPIPNFFNDYSYDSDCSIEETQIHAGIGELNNYIPEETLENNTYGYNSMLPTNSGKIIYKLWAGPSHWKIKYNINRREFYSGATESLTAKRRKVSKKRDFKRVDMFVEVPNFSKSKTTRISAKSRNTCSPEDLCIPYIDETEYTISGLLSKPSVLISQKRKVNPGSSSNDDVQDDSFNNEADSDLEMLIGEENKSIVGSLVEELELVPGATIPYALRAKHIDMHQLKTGILHILKDQTYPITFSDLFKRLMGELNDQMRKDITSSVTIVGLLHLCNDYNLRLEQLKNDMIIPSLL